MEEKPQDIEWIVLIVGGTNFQVERHVLNGMNSEFINRFIDPDSPFLENQTREYIVHADPEIFSILLHFFRYGKLLFNERIMLMEQADFWGVSDQIGAEMEQMKRDQSAAGGARIKRMIPTIRQVFYKAFTEEMHHNYRYDDGSGRRIYCSICRHRDFDSRFSPGDDYTECIKCRSKIKYKRDLDWCHQCKLCIRCQKSRRRFNYEFETPECQAINLDEIGDKLQRAWGSC